MPPDTTAPSAPPEFTTTLIATLANMSRADAQAAFGQNYRGLLQHLIGGDHLHLWPGITLGRNSAGKMVAITFPDRDGQNITLDYATAHCMDTPGLRPVWQPGNLNIARRVSRPAEEALMRSLRTPAPAFWIGHPDPPDNRKIPVAAATRIATALLVEMLWEGVGAARESHLTVLRTAPPSLRTLIARAILNGDTRAGHIRDLIHQAPILILSPRLLIVGAGHSPKKTLARIGLPANAKRIKAGAVAPLAAHIKTAQFDAKKLDLTWISADFCRRLPAQMGLQRIALDVGGLLTLAGHPQALVAELALWLLSGGLRDISMADLPRPTRRKLVTYLVASNGTCAALGVPPFRTDLTLIRATALAVLLHENARDLPGGSTEVWPRPNWAPHDQPLTGTRSTLLRITCEAELRQLGRQASNCAAQHADGPASGRTAIFKATRPAHKGDSAHFDRNGDVITAIIELTSFHGQIAILQIEAPGNRPPPAGIVAALAHLTDRGQSRDPA